MDVGYLGIPDLRSMLRAHRSDLRLGEFASIPRRYTQFWRVGPIFGLYREATEMP